MDGWLPSCGLITDAVSTIIIIAVMITVGLNRRPLFSAPSPPAHHHHHHRQAPPLPPPPSSAQHWRQNQYSFRSLHGPVSWRAATAAERRRSCAWRFGGGGGGCLQRPAERGNTCIQGAVFHPDYHQKSLTARRTQHGWVRLLPAASPTKWQPNQFSAVLLSFRIYGGKKKTKKKLSLIIRK